MNITERHVFMVEVSLEGPGLKGLTTLRALRWAASCLNCNTNHLRATIVEVGPTGKAYGPTVRDALNEEPTE